MRVIKPKKGGRKPGWCERSSIKNQGLGLIREMAVVYREGRS
jgi:hypothetical protein